MKYDRSRIKAAAKDRLAQADPKPWTVALMYVFLVLDLSALAGLFLLIPQVFSGGVLFTLLSWLLSILCALVFVLLLMVFHAGYTGYTLRLWHTGKGGPMDLVTGFFRSADVLILYDYLVVVCLGWPLLSALMSWGLRLLLGLFLPETAMGAVSFLIRTAALAFCIDRLLRYALAVHILLDRPELSPMGAVTRSIRLMKGRKLDFILFQLSFLGWELACAAIVFLAVFPGLLIQLVVTGLPGWFLTPFAVVGVAASLPLRLWLSAYRGAATAGFYDAACAPPFPGASPLPAQGGKRLK